MTDPAQELNAPETGRHRIEAKLGAGGMGSVYRAVETVSGRTVALKTLDSEGKLGTALFEREYHTLVSLQHPRVIDVYDFGIDQAGRRYYTMELLDGDDLSAISPAPWRRVCQYICDVATLLALLHARRLLHRDVSPRNVRIDPEGRAKLIDFGALASFGVASEIVGTPACIAPEVWRQLDLDQRSDLFSLGVVAYHALTGVLPFPSRALRYSTEATVRVPRAPSERVEGIPPALDQLVLSLLSFDPLARPVNAAEVIVRLGALTELVAEPLTGVTESHLLSASLCGRARERVQLSRHVERTLAGEGSVVVIEGESGMGRTRLAGELLIEARLAGMATIRIEAQAHDGADGVMGAIAQMLLDTAPAEAQESLPPYLPVLGEAFPRLRDAANTGRSSLEPGRAPPRSERRPQLQSELVSWLQEFAQRVPLLVIVDDVHVCDSRSAGALAALAYAAREHRLLLVVTEELGVRAPVAVEQLKRLGARIKLRALSAEEVGELVGSVFGEIPNRERLTHWLFSVGLGNPQQSLDLLSHLVDQGTIRYADGAWTLPAELSERNLPSSLEDALAARVARLSTTATALVQLFALHPGALSLNLCSELMPDVERSEMFGAVDELRTSQLLSASGESYRLRHQSVGELLTKSLEGERLRALHLDLARALMAGQPQLMEPMVRGAWRGASTPELGRALQAGWHYLRGQDERTASALLRNAGIELTRRGDGLFEAVPALEVALEAYHKQGRSRYERAYLMVPLTLAGTYTDFRVCYRYGQEVLDILLEATGMQLAGKLQRWFGVRVGLFAALALAAARFSITERRTMARNFREAVLGVIGLGSAVMGTATPLLDRELSSKMLKHLRPLAGFPPKHPARIAYEFQVSLNDATFGRYVSSRKRGQAVLESLLKPGTVPGLPEEARIQLKVGALILLGSLNSSRVDGSVHEIVKLLEEESTSVSRETAAGTLAVYYANRGEHSKFESYQREVDVLSAQHGSTWRHDVILPRNLWWTYALCEDVMGLKRCMRQLEAICPEAPSLEDARDATRACYLAERGKQDEALQKYGDVLKRTSSEPTAYAMRFVGAYARILRRAGQLSEARTLCETALQRLSSEQLEFVPVTFGVNIELAMSTAQLGDHADAVVQLEDMLAEQQRHDNPMVHGLIWGARAQVALWMEDREAFTDALDEMSTWLRRTENPALIGQCRTLADAGRRAGMLADTTRYSAPPMAPVGQAVTGVRSAFGACRGPEERIQQALDLVVSASRAERGYLYLLEPAGLRFTAPTVGLEPPEALLHELAARLEDAKHEAAQLETEDHTMPAVAVQELQTVVEAGALCIGEQDLAGTPYQSLMLFVPEGDGVVAVGAVALVPGDEAIQPLGAEYLEEVARGLYGAGDLKTAYFGPGKSIG